MASKQMSVTSLPMNFRISLADRVRAAHGLPAHVRRMRRIEDMQEGFIKRLSILRELASEQYGESPEAKAWFMEEARQLDLKLLNDLIDRHNRYYPIEANLPIDVQTGRVIMGGQPWKPLERVTLEGLIERASGVYVAGHG